MLFAHLKRILGLGRLRRHGPSRQIFSANRLSGSACGVQDEFTLAATAQNLRKLAKLKPLVTATGSKVVDLETFKINQRDSRPRQAETKEFLNTIGLLPTFAAGRTNW